MFESNYYPRFTVDGTTYEVHEDGGVYKPSDFRNPVAYFDSQGQLFSNRSRELIANIDSSSYRDFRHNCSGKVVWSNNDIDLTGYEAYSDTRLHISNGNELMKIIRNSRSTGGGFVTNETRYDNSKSSSTNNVGSGSYSTSGGYVGGTIDWAGMLFKAIPVTIFLYALVYLIPIMFESNFYEYSWHLFLMVGLAVTCAFTSIALGQDGVVMYFIKFFVFQIGGMMIVWNDIWNNPHYVNYGTFDKLGVFFFGIIFLFAGFVIAFIPGIIGSFIIMKCSDSLYQKIRINREKENLFLICLPNIIAALYFGIKYIHYWKDNFMFLIRTVTSTHNNEDAKIVFAGLTVAMIGIGVSYSVINTRNMIFCSAIKLLLLSAICGGVLYRYFGFCDTYTLESCVISEFELMSAPIFALDLVGYFLKRTFQKD